MATHDKTKQADQTAAPVSTGEWIRPKDVAAHFGVSHVTVYRWMNAGHIRSTLVGGSRMIPRAELESIAKATGRDLAS